MTNITNANSNEPRQALKETVAPRLRELLDDVPASELMELNDQPLTRIEIRKGGGRVEGEIAAAIFAPVIGILTAGLLNLSVPVIEGLGLRALFFENGLSNLTVVLTIGAWLLSWVNCYEMWRDRTVSRAKLYSVSIIGLMIAAACFVPEIYRLLE